MTQAGVVQSNRGSPVLWIIGIAIVAAVFAIAFFGQDDGDNVGGFADPTGTGLEGLLGLRLLIEESGGDVVLDLSLIHI